MTNELFFSQRTDWELNPNQIISSLKELKDRNIEVLDLTESNPTNSGFDYPIPQILKGLSAETNMKYTPSPQGSLEAREAIVQYYRDQGSEVSPQQVFLTSSTSEAYSFLFRLVTNPGDHVLLPRPSYPLFQFLADLNDITMETYPLAYHDEEKLWLIDLEKLKEMIHPKTRAIVLVNPNNPTGSFIKKGEIESIISICQEHNLSIICDEVFLDYAMEDYRDKIASLVDTNQVLTFVMSGISKLLGLPQLKLSWIIINGPDELQRTARERLEVICDTYLSVNTPSQNSLKEWLSFQPSINQEILSRIQDNRQRLLELLTSENHIQLIPSEGGWYAILGLPGSKSEEQWTLELLKEEHVFVHPGYFFDLLTEPFIVISLLTPCDVFQEGIRRILKLTRLGSTEKLAN